MVTVRCGVKGAMQVGRIDEHLSTNMQRCGGLSYCSDEFSEIEKPQRLSIHRRVNSLKVHLELISGIHIIDHLFVSLSHNIFLDLKCWCDQLILNGELRDQRDLFDTFKGR